MFDTEDDEWLPWKKLQMYDGYLRAESNTIYFENKQV